MTPATKKTPFTRLDEALEFVQQIEDSSIQAAVRIALTRTIMATVPTHDQAGNLIPAIETSEPADLLFLVKLYFGIFRRKKLVVDILSGTHEDWCL